MNRDFFVFAVTEKVCCDCFVGFWDLGVSGLGFRGLGFRALGFSSGARENPVFSSLGIWSCLFPSSWCVDRVLSLLPDFQEMGFRCEVLLSGTKSMMFYSSTRNWFKVAPCFCLEKLRALCLQFACNNLAPERKACRRAKNKPLRRAVPRILLRSLGFGS